MRRTNTRARKLRHVRAAVRAALLAAACSSAAHAQAAAHAQQEPPRVVVETVLIPTKLPVDLVGVEVGGEALRFPEGKEVQSLSTVSFDAREGWLRQFAFKIRNRSDKAMVSVTLHGTLGTGEEGDVPMMIEALYGQELDESAHTGRPPRGDPRRLMPGEAAEVRWSADDYERMVKFLLTKHPLAAYRRMRIDLREARFEDGTAWTMSGRYRIDPKDPRKWTRIDGGGAPPEIAPDLKAGERIVEVETRRAAMPDDSDALAVTAISVHGQRVTPGQPFAAGADWLRTLTVRVRNESAKPIALIGFSFSLPEARHHDAGLGFSFRFGEYRPPGGAAAPDAKRLAPGEETELTFLGDEYDSTFKFVEQQSGLAELTRVRVSWASVVFADGTRAFVSDPLRAKRAAAKAGTK